MARSNVLNNIGIAWIADPDPEVFEYLIYWTEDDSDNPGWLINIDEGALTPDAIVVGELQYLFAPNHPENADHAVVSHARDLTTDIERWSTPYTPAEYQDIPLDQSVAALAGPSGGTVLQSE